MDNGLKRYRKWVKVDCSRNPIHINTTTGQRTYTFPRPIRNPKISCTIKGKYTASGGSGSTTLQIGYGGNYNRYNGWWYGSGSSNSATFSDTYQVADNVKRTSLTLGPWAAAWGDYQRYTASVTSSDIWITEYEELR